MSKNDQFHFDTIAIHKGLSKDGSTHSSALPIYQTAAYNFESPEHAADLFALRDFGNIYTRLTNPTNAAIEERLGALHKGTYCVATASGHSALVIACFNILGAGDSIVSSNSLYGGTWNIFLHSFKKLGIDVRFVDPTDTEGFLAASDDTTKLWFVETLGNPRLDVPDLDALSAAGRTLGIPLMVDNTFASPYLCRPIEHGAAIVIESLTKWIGGHGTSIGGAVIDGGNFDWSSGRFEDFTEEDPSYHGVNFWDTFGDFPGLGNVAFGIRLRTLGLRDFGPTLSPFNAQQIGLGIETLSLRMQRHCENAFEVAAFLQDHPKVTWVTYPGLPEHPTHDNARKVLSKGYGGVIVFGVANGREGGKTFIDSLALTSHLANVGDAKTLVIHPASTTHSQLNEDELRTAGIGEDLIRLSVGLEDVRDIIADLDQALASV